MDGTEPGHVTPIEEHATQAYLQSRVVRLVDWTDQSLGGSAVKIRIGDNYFLATAAHVIPNSHDIRALAPGRPNTFVTDFSSQCRNSADDVGLLEITREAAHQLGGNFITLEEILTDVDQDSSFSVVVVGYPGQLIHKAKKQISDDVVAMRVGPASLCFYSATLPSRQWPTRDLERPATPQKDVFASFDPDLQMKMNDLGDMSIPTRDVSLGSLDLRGMSGGGIWIQLPPPESDRVWCPQLRLIALDVSVNRSAKWLRGSAIGNWLALVCEHYPHLRGVIAKSHPQFAG